VPILTILLLIPILGSGIIMFRDGNESRAIALLFSMLTMAVALVLLYQFDSSINQLQFSESVVWNARMGTSYAVGIDGISLSMVLLANF